MAGIIIDKVTKRFPDGTETLSDVSLNIEDGEFFILVGPSGCGKSTLLNMIVGLEEITRGEIRVDGRVINTLDPKDRNMAMVFQSYALYPHMTVRENMAFPLKLAKKPKEEILQKVKQAAAILELTELLDRKPASLSGGQRQRVAMGRAIVRQPRAFLMDEPLSNLDAKLRVQMRTELARLQKRLGTTTIYVTHDQSEAMTLGDRVALLYQGKVQQVGTPRELYTVPNNLSVASFIGSPAINFLPARVEKDRLILPMTQFKLPPNLEGQLSNFQGPAIAGIRPEHLQEADSAKEKQAMFPAFKATVDVIEWMDAEVYAHFNIQGEISESLQSLTKDLEIKATTDKTIRLVARLDGASYAREGVKLKMQLDPCKLHLFDIQSGENLIC
ncbi:carbohydrate ABC transporter ATP-binding protein, CUT1 family [Nitrosococcus oceani ATCC 19707]|uniref:Carbohydrate ABC transporter ATP-binding protein, CUT1 family n=2 Tax=Nitrosococcus oceani TaxID=1229 RepID=Q3JED7_NITOC|nr:sn-glycerol-3-phosphate ABC transporter ATP-binding protein UgpC [Nitrosococcus oceani]ABA56809.1 carbohydrate ABC transporter ATP-binding protein, CUT1 family [Nitrosococcus oceani ATCC 19707]KFI20763.1 ABC transporter ATP-binding protein [Nitrosococcus oceani C-27]GEM20566.1 ABC transporter ATP-binding protein [Nitrosococcus oceani]